MKTTKRIMISLDAQSIDNAQAIIDSGRVQSKSSAIRLALALTRAALDSPALVQAVREELARQYYIAYSIVSEEVTNVT